MDGKWRIIWAVRDFWSRRKAGGHFSVQVTEHAVLGWPDAPSCSEVQAANSSTSDIKL